MLGGEARKEGTGEGVCEEEAHRPSEEGLEIPPGGPALATRSLNP